MRLYVGLMNSEVSWNQPKEMTEQMRLLEGCINSKMDLDQQVQLTKEEDLGNILMIGGIRIFLPLSPKEAEICVADVATAEGQPTKTVKEELEKISEAAQEEKENEHFEEWINAFSQGVERKEVVALKLTVEDKVLTPWEMELEILQDRMKNPEPARELAEVELSKNVTEQQVIQEETVEMVFAAGWQVKATEEEEEDGMGDHDDLPNCRKFLQLGRLKKQSQPLEQLDEVIENIRKFMIR